MRSRLVSTENSRSMRKAPLFLVTAMLCAAVLVGCDKDSPTAPTQPAPPTSTTPPVTPVAAAPTLTAVAPGTLTSGAATTVTLTGTGFVTGSTVAVSGTNVAVSDVSIVSATSITARLTVAAAADIGARSITVTTSGGTTSAQTVTINPTTPAINSASPSSAPPGSTVDVTFRGTGFVQGATTVTVSGSGVTVLGTTISSADQSGTQDESGTMVAGNSTTLVVRLSIDRDATPGARTVTVTTAGGSSSGFTFAVGAPFPVIERFGANPVIIQRGQSASLFWRGVANATTCSINIGIGNVPCADGSVTVTPSVTTEYMFSASGPGGREWTYITVNVEEPPPPVVVVPPSGSQTFTAVGTATFTVPAGVTQLNVTAFGARGGNGANFGTGDGAVGAAGARVTTTMAVTPGEVLDIVVGGRGADAVVSVGGSGGFNGGGNGATTLSGVTEGGGGGGGASDLRRGGTRLVVAGGGGGGGGFPTGGPGGAGGQSGDPGNIGAGPGAGGGTGATPTTFGLGGAAQGGGFAGTNGAAALGGNGGTAQGSSGGGGGGGVFGGGGGGGAQNFTGGGGGGGSSMGQAGAAFITGADAANSGNGKIVITWP